jgi:ribosomal protein L22
MTSILCQRLSHLSLNRDPRKLHLLYTASCQLPSTGEKLSTHIPSLTTKYLSSSSCRNDPATFNRSRQMTYDFTLNRHFLRLFSTRANIDNSTQSLQPASGFSPSQIGAQLIESPDGRKFAAFTIARQKLKPHIVKRRLDRMRTYEGAEKNIRGSPWRLNLVCQLAAGLPLQDALNQLEFCKKSKAPLVQKVLKRTANLADIRDGLQISQLEVAECFATKGTHLKRIKIMGRGRAGRMEHKFGHFRVVLREIDFKLRLYQAPSIGQKKRWYLLQQQAQQDAERVQMERDEITKLEKQAASAAAKKK